MQTVPEFSQTRAEDIGPDQVRRHIGAAMGRHVGRGRYYSVADISAMTGLCERTVYALFDRGETADPPVSKILRLLTVPRLGDELADRLLSLAGMAAHPLEPSDVDHFGVNAVMAAANDVLASGLRDGRLSPRERAEFKAALRDLLAKAESYLVKGGES